MNSKTSEARRTRQAEWERQAERRQRLIWGGVAAAAVAFVAILGYLVWQQARPIPRTGETVELQGAEHIPVGATHVPYNSDPPTSGPHYAQPADAGFYLEPLDDGNLVHSLEHGYVIISYNCAKLADAACTQLKQDLQSTMNAAGLSKNTDTPKLIAVPRPTLTTTLALTSWGRVDRFDTFDRARILNYIKNFRDTAPEPFAP